MSALGWIAAVPILAGIAFMIWWAVSNPTETAWASRVAAAETWEMLAGPTAPSIPVSAQVATWTAGGKVRRWVPPVQDGLITIVADENVVLLVNRKSHPAQRRLFRRADSATSFAARPSRLGGQILTEQHSGAKLSGWEVDQAIEGLRTLGWSIPASTSG